MGFSLLFTAENQILPSSPSSSHLVTCPPPIISYVMWGLCHIRNLSVNCYEDDISCTILLLCVHNWTFFLRILSDVLPPEYFYSNNHMLNFLQEKNSNSFIASQSISFYFSYFWLLFRSHSPRFETLTQWRN